MGHPDAWKQDEIQLRIDGHDEPSGSVDLWVKGPNDAGVIEKLA